MILSRIEGAIKYTHMENPEAKISPNDGRAQKPACHDNQGHNIKYLTQCGSLTWISTDNQNLMLLTDFYTEKLLFRFAFPRNSISRFLCARKFVTKSNETPVIHMPFSVNRTTIKSPQ